MLLSIIDKYRGQGDEKLFDSVLQNIKESYWPAKYIEANQSDLIKKLPAWAVSKSSDQAISEVVKCISDCMNDIADHKKFYSGYGSDGYIGDFELPFSGSFFNYFIKRKYSIPYRDPQEHFNNLFRLEPEKLDKPLPRDSAQVYNYSKNYGDYNHFINVVVATARLIEYFSQKENIESLFVNNASYYSEVLAYKNRIEWGEREYKRCFLLMLAAFYHDLGKTIVPPRHAMEGSIILANHTTRPVYLLNQISKTIYGFEFGVQDYIYISDLVYFHDQYGTLNTGEAGYLRLVDLLHRIKLFAHREDHDQSEKTGELSEEKQTFACVFDLWVLNLADTMVSISTDKFGQKTELQESLFNRDQSIERIQELLHMKNARKHDLQVTFALSKIICEKHHSNDLSKIEHAALDYAKRHAVERIYRLIRAIFPDYMPYYKKIFSSESSAMEILDNLAKMKESDWHAIVSHSITAVSDFNEFVNRFAWVGQLDYSFSFFQKIAQRALELINLGEDYGWIYKRNYDDYQDNYFISAKANFFAENFSSILVQILHHLIFREREFDRLINFEFRDAAERLTDEKIDRIISVEGPHRARKAIQLALEGIYFFK